MISFDETNAVYHANAAIGSGAIRAFIRSPALFRDDMDGLCGKTSGALLFGIASHCSMLEPQKYSEIVAVRAEGDAGDFRTSAGKAWKAGQGGKVIITRAQGEALSYMHARMPVEVREIFARCRKEVTVRTRIGALDVQCRPDLWSVAEREKWDLKTIADIDKLDLEIFKHLYHVQDEWYSRVIDAETGVKILRSGFIFVESAPPYRWRIAELDLDFREMAKRAVDDALAGISARMKSGCWDDPADLHHLASPPQWAANQLDMDADEEEVA